MRLDRQSDDVRGVGEFDQRFGPGSARLRKIGIVALARKLLIALWRFVETGVLPEGGVLKATACSA